MDVTYIHSGLWPSNSPSISFTTYNALGLASVFRRCRFYIRQNGDDTPDRVLEDRFGRKRPDNLEIIPVRGRGIFHGHFFYYRKVSRAVCRDARHNGPGIVISRNTTFLPRLAAIKKKTGARVYYETHDFYADLQLRDDLSAKKRGRYQDLERKYIPRLDGVICLQEAQAALYRRFFPGQDVFVARTGTTPVSAGKPGDGAGTRLLYVGSLDSHKGLFLLLEALGRSTTRPGLTVVGGKNTAELEMVRHAVKKYYPGGDVTVTGWLDKKGMAGHMAAAAAGVLPLRDTFFNRYLTSPLKYFDYISWGLPVIAADLPTMRELSRDGADGLLFPAGSADGLAEAVDRLFSDAGLRQSLADAARRQAGDMTWENRARTIQAHLERRHG